MNESAPFPQRYEELEPWAAQRGVTLDEARRRFAQGAVCQAIASSPWLAQRLTFKGGNALLFAYGGDRSTTDLDFSAEDARVWARAGRDYDSLRPTVAGRFIPFETARRAILAFVERLDLPESGTRLQERTALPASE